MQVESIFECKYLLTLSLVEAGVLNEPHLDRVDKHDEEGDGERRLVQCPRRLVLLLPLAFLARRHLLCDLAVFFLGGVAAHF